MKKMSKRGRRFERRLAERRKRAASEATFAEVARILIEARKKKQDKDLLLDPVVLGEGGIRQ